MQHNVQEHWTLRSNNVVMATKMFRLNNISTIFVYYCWIHGFVHFSNMDGLEGSASFFLSLAFVFVISHFSPFRWCVFIWFCILATKCTVKYFHDNRNIRIIHTRPIQYFSSTFRHYVISIKQKKINQNFAQ